MSDQIVHVSDATFDAEVLNSDIPVLVPYSTKSPANTTAG
jgi:thioredoxin 1